MLLLLLHLRSLLLLLLRLCHLTAPIIGTCNCNGDSCVVPLLIAPIPLSPSTAYCLYLSLSFSLCVLSCPQPIAQLKVTHYLFTVAAVAVKCIRNAEKLIENKWQVQVHRVLDSQIPCKQHFVVYLNLN